MHVPGLECTHAGQDHSRSPCNVGADRSRYSTAFEQGVGWLKALRNKPDEPSGQYRHGRTTTGVGTRPRSGTTRRGALPGCSPTSYRYLRRSRRAVAWDCGRIQLPRSPSGIPVGAASPTNAQAHPVPSTACREKRPDSRAKRNREDQRWCGHADPLVPRREGARPETYSANVRPALLRSSAADGQDLRDGAATRMSTGTRSPGGG